MAEKKKVSLSGIKPAFWLANAQEAGERLAYFGVRAVLPLMMVGVGTGRLDLSMVQKGAIFGVWAFIQCIVPMVSGGFSESFGYKKSLITAFIINTLGYILMANVLNLAGLITGTPDVLNQTVNFVIMMVAACTIGLGTAIFKPPVQGTVAKSLNEDNSAFGFGLFYWVVNVGGFLAPLAASALRGSDAQPTWHYVFYGAAVVTIINLIITILFFKEPERTPEEIEKHKKESVVSVFVKTIKTLFNDRKMLIFLLIVSGFWLMFMQLWDLFPNFLDEWADRRDVGQFLHQFSIFDWLLEGRKAGWAIKPEMIINIDSLAIICFVIPLSALFSRYKMMTALVLGMVVSVIGFMMTGVFTSGALACFAVFIFAIGEIICSPKFNEYIGMTAPADKKAIYMGFSNIPFAIGWGAGDFVSGHLYDAFSSKVAIGREWLSAHNVNSVKIDQLDVHNAQQYLIDKLQVAKESLPEVIKTSGKSLAELKDILKEHSLSLTDECSQLLANKEITDIDACQIEEAKELISGVDLNNLLTLLQQKNVTDVPLDYCSLDCVVKQVQTVANLPDAYAVTEVLWQSSSPWISWVIMSGIGFLSMVGMVIFYLKSGMAEKDNKALDENAAAKAPTNDSNDADASDKAVDASDKSTDDIEASDKAVDASDKSTDDVEASDKAVEASDKSTEEV